MASITGRAGVTPIWVCAGAAKCQEVVVAMPFYFRGSIASTALMLFSFIPTPGRAQQFSADIAQTPAHGTNASRIYVGATKLRLQTFQAGQPEGSMIWDMSQNAMTIVMDKDHSYINANSSPIFAAIMNRPGGPAMWQLFRPVSSGGNPCTAWNSIVIAGDTAHSVHSTCTSAGSDMVNGRAAQKWNVTFNKEGRSESGAVWIDNRLHVVSKSQDSEGSMELKNIQEGPQADAVFAIPAGYHPVNTAALMAKLGSVGADSSIAALLGGAARDVGNQAAHSTIDASKQKANDEVKKKLKSILHFP
jgi:hypothetical protein